MPASIALSAIFCPIALAELKLLEAILSAFSLVEAEANTVDPVESKTCAYKFCEDLKTDNLGLSC
jgi:hypothetical protein